jgi:hypothetical protein
VTGGEDVQFYHEYVRKIFVCYVLIDDRHICASLLHINRLQPLFLCTIA